VVDPHADTRELYVNCLQQTGWETIEAEDGGMGLSLALSKRPRLLLTELRLARIDGYHLINILRRDETTASISIVVVTADARPFSLDRARRAGADAVFTKPAAIDVLIASFKDVLQRQTELHAQANALRFRVKNALATSDRTLERTRSLSRAMGRYPTTTPPAPPPALTCTNCTAALTYERSYVGGVNERSPEQWDYYECPKGCGQFQYRQRSRRLRRIP
jgi:CheY-like chemotaxis protein